MPLIPALLLTVCVTTLVCAATSPKKAEVKPDPAIVVRGNISLLGAGADTPTFTYENRRTKAGNEWESVTFYRDKEGKNLVEEKSRLGGENGETLLHYEYKQLQVDESGEAAIKDGKVIYKFRTSAGEKEDSEDFTPDMIVPDMVPSQIRAHWDALMKDETVKVRLLLPEKLDSFGFKFFKDAETKRGNADVVDFVLKPSSFIIAALAPSIRISMAKAAPHELVETSGRLPVRVPEKIPPQTRKDYKAIDGLLVIERK